MVDRQQESVKVGVPKQPGNDVDSPKDSEEHVVLENNNANGGATGNNNNAVSA